MAVSTVKLACGPASVNRDVAGESVSEILNSEAYGEVLGLTGNETIEVRNAGSEDFRQVNASYRMQAGDYVRFSRAAGTKG